MASDVVDGRSQSHSRQYLNNLPLSIISFNMHGFNQGAQSVRDLALANKPDVILLQEHWLTPANLHKLSDAFPQFLCFGTSAMRSCVESGILCGRPFGGVSVLVNKRLSHCTKILCASDRYVVVSIGNCIIVNLYLPCVGTNDRLCIIDEVLHHVSEWMFEFRDCVTFIGGDFNTDLDKSGPAADVINRFARDHCLSRCDLLGVSCGKQFTFYNECQGSQSTIDFFLTSDPCTVSHFHVVDLGCNLSDHMPIMIECVLANASTDCVSRNVSDGGPTATVSHLRWDHGDLSRYRELTHLTLQPILTKLIELESHSYGSKESLDYIYENIKHSLVTSAALSIPRRKLNFYKFWWNQDLDNLKAKAISSCNMWKEAGRPRSGPIFHCYRKDKAAYRLEIRRRRVAETEQYTNDLHEALMQKQGASFWKCWRSKFDNNKSAVNTVDGVTDPKVIIDHFVSHFSKSCNTDNETAADRLKRLYVDRKSHYHAASVNCSFDAELVESIILKMKRGKAPDLDGLTAEHLYFCSPILPCILAKLFNLCTIIRCVPVSFGRSYTVPILKDKSAVLFKSINVNDFRGISISPIISKVFEHCILDTYSEIFVTCDNQFGFKKNLSCSQAIYSLRCVIDEYITAGSTVSLCALDLSKAFDKMSHWGLFIKLMDRGIPSNLLGVFEYWFSISSTCVRWDSHFSNFFTLLSGVRQGGVLSPYFFALYIDSVYEKVRATGLGCHLKWHCMSILLYADDIILLAPSVCTLQRLLSVCESELELLDMSLNTSKSVCMRVGPWFNRPCSKLTTNDGRELVWTDCMRDFAQCLGRPYLVCFDFCCVLLFVFCVFCVWLPTW